MRLQPLRQRSTPGRARHWNGERRQRPLTNFYDQPTNTLLRRPLESAQYVSIKYTERLAEAGIEPSVGSVGDSYDNALAETSRSANERYRPESGFAETPNIAGGIPPALQPGPVCRRL